MILKNRYHWGPHSSTVLKILLVALVLDQASKYYLVHIFDLQSNQPVDITPFFNLVMVWNRGVSYGMFQQHSAVGQVFLTSLSFVASVFLWAWASRTANRLPAFSLGLLIGGALGNGIDRAVYGAVADFFHFYIGDFSWYVFNPADVFIVAGVVGLLYDSIFMKPKTAKSK